MAKDIAKLRNKLGLTQNKLAKYLQVKVSTLSMAEIGQRELPLIAAGRALHLETIVAISEQLPLLKTESTSVQLQETINALQSHANNCNIQQQLLKRSLTRMQQKAAAANLLLRAAPLLKEKLPPNSERELQWLENNVKDALYDDYTNGSLAQILVQQKIASYAASVANANTTIALLTTELTTLTKID